MKGSKRIVSIKSHLKMWTMHKIHVDQAFASIEKWKRGTGDFHRSIRQAFLLAGASLLLGSCAAPTQAGHSKYVLGSMWLTEAALEDLGQHHPRLTQVERDALHQRKNISYASKNENTNGTIEYSLEWIARDHRVDVSWKGDSKAITSGEVRRFALKDVRHKLPTPQR